MSAPPFEPIVVNRGFETGLLAPWIPSDPAAATIANGSQAYTGDYYLALRNAPGNRANWVHQPLNDLDASTNYTVTVQVSGPAVSAANYCSAWVHVGANVTTGLIDQVDLSYDDFGKWVTLEGQFQPKSDSVELYLRAACTLSGASHTSVLFWDDIVVAPAPVLD